MKSPAEVRDKLRSCGKAPLALEVGSVEANSVLENVNIGQAGPVRVKLEPHGQTLDLPFGKGGEKMQLV